jgi:hypothetical protein
MKRWLKWMVPATFLVAALAFAGCNSGDGGDETGEDAVTEADEGGTDPDGCVPQCDGKQCGDDGCGDICGHCYTMEGALNDDLCLPDQTCTVCGCGEKECGVDACGSPCGQCPSFHTCSVDGLCDLDAASCGATGFAGATQEAKAKGDNAGFSLKYSGTVTKDGAAYTLYLDIDSRNNLGGPTGPGTFKAQFKNFEQGGLWLYAKVLSDGVESWYTPSFGDIVIQSLDSQGGQFKAVLDKVVLQEVVLDEGVPVKLPNGQTWCLDGAELVADVFVTPTQCGNKPIGTKLNKAIANFQLQNCNGEWVDLYEDCQQGEALWIVATAGW